MTNHLSQHIDHCFRKQLLPTTISTLSTVVASVIDAALVSYYYGSENMAVVTLFIPLLSIWACIYEGMGIATSSLLAERIGMNNKREGSRIAEKSNTITLLISIAVACIGICLSFIVTPSMFDVDTEFFNDAIWYARFLFLTSIPLVFNEYLLFLLRADSAPQIAGISTCTQVVLNLLFDILFMGQMQLGMKGAALALLLASTVALIITLIYIIRSSTIIRLYFRLPDLALVKRLFPYTFNSISDNVIDCILALIVNISVLIVFGIEIATIIYIINYLVMLVYSFGLCFTNSMIPILSFYIGKKNNQAITYISHKVIRYALIIGIIFCLIMLIFTHDITTGIFSYNYSAFYEAGNTAIRIYSLSIPFDMVNAIVICICQQTHQFKLSLRILLTSNVPIIICILIATFIIHKPDIIWWSFFVTKSITCVGWIVYMNLRKYRLHADSFLCLTQ